MGLRGPGATRLRLAREAAGGIKRKLPWQKRGLSRVERVIAFLQFLPITKGKLEGKRMKLLPAQRQFIEDVYGPSGKERVTLAIKSEPRGNGKTGLITGIALCHLLGPESEPRGEIYSAAIDREQAGLLYNEMEAIILAVPEFAARCNPQRFKKRIEVLSGDGIGSTYEALSSDARRAHGLAPSLWIYDELAQAKDRILLDNLMTAMGKRKSALGIIISTQAPSDDHPLSQLIDDGLSGRDPAMVVHLKTAPLDADPFALETLQAVNSALGVFLDQQDLLKEAERARRIPAFEPAYRNLRLNQRVDANAENRIVTQAVWKLGAKPIDMERLRGRRCWGGLDLSGKHDLCAFVLVFPDDDDPPNFDILPFFWTPEGQMEARGPAERDLFREWIQAQKLISMPGPVIRFSQVAKSIVDLSKLYDLQAVAYDRWRIDDFKLELDDLAAKIPLEPFGQGFKEMGPAIEVFAEIALTGRIRHGGHPVLTSNVANAITVSDPAGNLKIDKGKSNGRASVRIDGAVAMIMGLKLAEAAQVVNKPSVYETRGVLVL